MEFVDVIKDSLHDASFMDSNFKSEFHIFHLVI